MLEDRISKALNLDAGEQVANIVGLRKSLEPLDGKYTVTVQAGSAMGGTTHYVESEDVPPGAIDNLDSYELVIEPPKLEGRTLIEEGRTYLRLKK